jgi:acetyltransferase-like isoleucine patch superfamily enzyme
MLNGYRYLATSNHPLARRVRWLRRQIVNFTLPAPKVLVRPMLWTFVASRSIFYFLKRVLICEPLFKAYCKRHGHGVRTGVYIHWIMGKGDLVVGDHVEIDGKCSFAFAARFSTCPTLSIGDHTIIRHGCSFVVARRVAIGKHCLIASNVSIFESSGHQSDPSARLANLPPRPEDVRPITIGDNVWIAQRAIISPGVTIGDNSIVSAGSVVVSDVPPNTVVAGFPARKVASLAPPDPGTAPGDRPECSETASSSSVHSIDSSLV